MHRSGSWSRLRRLGSQSLDIDTPGSPPTSIRSGEGRRSCDSRRSIDSSRRQPLPPSQRRVKAVIQRNSSLHYLEPIQDHGGSQSGEAPSPAAQPAVRVSSSCSELRDACAAGTDHDAMQQPADERRASDALQPSKKRVDASAFFQPVPLEALQNGKPGSWVQPRRTPKLRNTDNPQPDAAAACNGKQVAHAMQHMHLDAQSRPCTLADDVDGADVSVRGTGPTGGGAAPRPGAAHLQQLCTQAEHQSAAATEMVARLAWGAGPTSHRVSNTDVSSSLASRSASQHKLSSASPA